MQQCPPTFAESLKQSVGEGWMAPYIVVNPKTQFSGAPGAHPQTGNYDSERKRRMKWMHTLKQIDPSQLLG